MFVIPLIIKDKNFKLEASSIQKYFFLLALFAICLSITYKLFPVASSINLHLIFNSKSSSSLRVAYDTGVGYSYLQQKDLISTKVGGENSFRQEIDAWLPSLPLKGLQISHLTSDNEFIQATLQTGDNTLNLDLEKLSRKKTLIVGEKELRELQSHSTTGSNFFRSSPILLALSITYIFSLLGNQFRQKGYQLKHLFYYVIPLSLGIIFLILGGGSVSYQPFEIILNGNFSEGSNKLALLSLETNKYTYPSNKFLVQIPDQKKDLSDLNISFKEANLRPDSSIEGHVVSGSSIIDFKSLSKVYNDKSKHLTYKLPSLKENAKIVVSKKNSLSRVLISNQGEVLYDVTEILKYSGSLYILQTQQTNSSDKLKVTVPWNPYNIPLTGLNLEFPAFSKISKGTNLQIKIDSGLTFTPQQSLNDHSIATNSFKPINGKKYLINHGIEVAFLGILIFLTFIFKFYFKIATEIATQHKQIFYLFCLLFCISAITYFLYLVALFPGSFTSDSTLTWAYGRTPFVANWQPLLYTLYSGVLSLFSESPALNASIQIILTSALISGLTCITIHRNKSWLPILGYLWATASVLISLYNLIFWKDVLYGLLIVFVALLAYEIKGRQIRNRTDLITLTCLLLLLSSFRHNGFILILGYPLILTFLKALTATQCKKVIFSTFSLFCILNLGVGSIIGAHKRTDYTNMNLSVRLNHIQSILQSNSNLDTAFLKDFTDPVSLKEKGIGVLFDSKTNQLPNEEIVSKFDKIILLEAAKNPSTFLLPLFNLFTEITLGNGYIWDNSFPKTTPNYAEFFSLIPAQAYYRPLSKSLEQFIEYWAISPLREKQSNLFYVFNFTLIIQTISVFLSLALFRFAPRTFTFTSVLLLGIIATLPTLQATDSRYLYFLYLGGIFVFSMLISELTSKINRSNVIFRISIFTNRNTICKILIFTFTSSVLLLGLDIKFPPLFPTHITITVIAKGEKSAEGEGTEVWLYAIKVGQHLRETQIPWSEVNLSPGWELQGDHAVSYYSQPNTLTWTGDIKTPVSLYFGSHRYSGNVLIKTNDGRTWEKELHSKEQKQFEKVEIEPLSTLGDKTINAFLISFVLSLVLCAMLGSKRSNI